MNLKKNNLIRNVQGFVTQKQIKNPSTSKWDLELSFYSVTDNQLIMDYKKVIPNNDYDNSYGNHINGESTTVVGLKNVDFNGDGLSEIILLLNDERCYQTDLNDPLSSECKDYKRYYVIDPEESIQNNAWYYPISMYADYDKEDKDVFTIYKAGDFNGDGVFDLLKLNQNKNPLLITFQKNAQNQYTSNIAPFTSVNDETIKGYWEDSLVGDFNGDGLSDLMMPGTSTSAIWHIYTSKGNGFKEETTVFVRPERNRRVYNDPNQDIRIYNPRTFVAYDINNDGKTDLISLESQRIFYRNGTLDNQWGAGYKNQDRAIFNVLSTFGGQYNTLNNVYIDGNINLSNANVNSVLAVNSNDLMGISVDMWTGAMLRRFIMTSIGSTNHAYGRGQKVASSKYFDISMEGRIISISQGGITTGITYKQLDKVKNPGLYDVAKAENYPYVEINQSAGMYVVSGLTQTTTSEKNLKQDFRYRGLTSNILGRGMIGFRKTARSSWYADGYENTKIWSGVEIDPLNDGVPVKEWSIRTNDDTKIFPANVSENNTQLLSFKSTSYLVDKILGGQVVTTVSDANKAKVT